MSVGYLVLIGALALVGFLVQNRLKSKFHKYGQVGLSTTMASTMYQSYKEKDSCLITTILRLKLLH